METPVHAHACRQCRFRSLVQAHVGKRSGLTYEVALKELSDKNDKAAKAAKAYDVPSLLKPATVASSTIAFPNRQTGPSKPAGFA
jgi:hypothetical protein